MTTPSFQDWLRSADEAAAAEKMATIIAGAGAAGVSVDRLRRIVGLYPETLEDVLKALVATGQVMVVQANGQRIYRAATRTGRMGVTGQAPSAVRRARESLS